jgi:nucleotide-binding universal stress UspA family protein
MRRLLVALDASRHSLAALDVSVCLAARLDAELAGLFVEDEDLLRWSRLPIGRAVDPSSATARHVDATAVEQELSAQAERARQALEAAAGRERVRWSFRVARGRVGRSLDEASREADLLALGRSSWAQAKGGPLGSTARFVVSESSARILLVAEGEHLADPVAVLYADAAEGERAFEVAASLARRDGGRVVLLSPGSAPPAPGPASSRVEDMEGLDLRERRIAAVEPEAVAAAVRREGARLLVLPASTCSEHEAGLARFIEAAPCPVLCVR